MEKILYYVIILTQMFNVKVPDNDEPEPQEPRSMRFGSFSNSPSFAKSTSSPKRGGWGACNTVEIVVGIPLFYLPYNGISKGTIPHNKAVLGVTEKGPIQRPDRRGRDCLDLI